MEPQVLLSPLIAFSHDASGLGLRLLAVFLNLPQQSLGEPPMLLRLAFGPSLFFPKIPGNGCDVIVSGRFQLDGGHRRVGGQRKIASWEWSGCPLSLMRPQPEGAEARHPGQQRRLVRWI